MRQRLAIPLSDGNPEPGPLQFLLRLPDALRSHAQAQRTDRARSSYRALSYV